MRLAMPEIVLRVRLIGGDHVDVTYEDTVIRGPDPDDCRHAQAEQDDAPADDDVARHHRGRAVDPPNDPRRDDERRRDRGKSAEGEEPGGR